MHAPRRSPMAVAVLLPLWAAAAAQDDLRDFVHLASGKDVRGRVAEPWAAREIVVMQGGKRVRVSRTDITGMELVGDRVREFSARRLQLRGNPRGQWILVEWAQTHDLPNLARLQAMRIALETDDERAHTFLGNRQRGGKWTWERDGRWYTTEQLYAQIVKSPLTLAGERFRLRCDGDLRVNLDALFDLERLGTWWFDTFGADLGLAEVLQPVEVFAHRDAT